MRTKLFEWAKNQGFELKDLAEMTGYSERHLRRIRDEGFPVTEDFQAGVVFKMGDWARSLFFGPVSPTGDVNSPTGDSKQQKAAEALDPAPERVGAGREGKDSGAVSAAPQGAKSGEAQ